METEKFSFYFKKIDELMRQLVQRIHIELKNNLVKGITGSQLFVLKTIYESKQMTVSSVAEELGVSLSAITAFIDKLAKAGFVHRLRDEDDRRLVWLTVTPKGEEILKVCLAGREQILMKYLGQLPEDDLEQLERIYEKLLAILREEEAKEKGLACQGK